MRAAWWCSMGLGIVACAGKAGDSAEAPTCSPAAGQGQMVADIDGTAWSAPDVTWNEAGESVQIQAPIAAGWRVTIVAQKTPDGDSVVSAMNAGDLPLTIPLQTGTEGGFALVYPDAGDSFETGAADGGAVEITASQGGVLSGCFAFQASDGASTLTVANGSFQALELVQTRR